MHADSLSADLRDHLYWWLAEELSGPRKWVMDASWFNECRKVAMMEARSTWAFLPPPEIRHPEVLLGLPIDIRSRDDRPGWMWRVPHLEEASQ